MDRKFINLDIGILMQSQSNQVFQEMLDLWPGAPRVKEVITQYKCSCSDPVTCERRTFQLVLGQASQGDREVAAKFIEEAAETCNTHEEIRDLMVRYYDKNCKHEHEEPEYQVIELSSEDAARLLERLLGGGSLN